MKVLQLLKAIKSDARFEDSKNFVADQLLDSFELIQLVDLLEEEFDITVSGKDIIPDNFVSVSSIENLILKSGGRIE